MGKHSLNHEVSSAVFLQRLTSFLKGKISYIILQYSMDDSTEQVHSDFDMGARGIIPWVRFFTNISNSTCCLQDSAIYGQWSTTKTVLWDSEKIFIFFLKQTDITIRKKCTRLEGVHETYKIRNKSQDYCTVYIAYIEASFYNTQF